MARGVELYGLLVGGNRLLVVAERFQGESQRVQRLDVRRVDLEGRLELLARGLPVVLDRLQLPRL
jgi:hypothetical protein